MMWKRPHNHQKKLHEQIGLSKQVVRDLKYMPSEIQQFFFFKLVLTAYTAYLNSKNICMDKNVLITEYCFSVYFILLPEKKSFFPPISVHVCT